MTPEPALYRHPITRYRGDDACAEPVEDLVAVEEPLQIRLRQAGEGAADIAVTMRTPGHDAELAAGFLFTEGVLRSGADVAGIRVGENRVTVELSAGAPSVDLVRLTRHVYTASSCGVCGKASIDSVRVGIAPAPRKGGPLLTPATLRALPEALRAAQPVFDRTGGLHAAALFSAAGDLLSLHEDVGRHNALDKLIGAALMAGGLPLLDSVLLVSGRASFELVQKAVVAGIPVLAAVGAPSSLAVQLAEESDTTLIGFLRGDRFNVYAAPWRIAPSG